MELGEGIRVELACCESVLLEEIARKETTQKSVAKTYRLALESSEKDLIDWGKVNRAIVARWSAKALERIKNAAWSGKCFSSRKTSVPKT